MEERLEVDKDFNKVIRQLKKVCDEDKTGKYQRILEQFKDVKVIH